jgi:hypothetical protein
MNDNGSYYRSKTFRDGPMQLYLCSQMGSSAAGYWELG